MRRHRLYCPVCGQRLGFYKNPDRLMCSKDGIIEPDKTLLTDPAIDVDNRFFKGRKKRK